MASAHRLAILSLPIRLSSLNRSNTAQDLRLRWPSPAYRPWPYATRRCQCRSVWGTPLCDATMTSVMRTTLTPLLLLLWMAGRTLSDALQHQIFTLFFGFLFCVFVHTKCSQNGTSTRFLTLIKHTDFFYIFLNNGVVFVSCVCVGGTTFTINICNCCTARNTNRTHRKKYL